MKSTQPQDERQPAPAPPSGTTAPDDRLFPTARMALVGRLAGALAHKMRNSLHTVKGYAELALMDLSQRDNAEQALLTSVERSHEMGRMLAYFSVLLNRRDTGAEDVALTELARDTVAFLEMMGESADCHLSVAANGDGGYVRCRRDQIQHLLLQLIFNATDATGPGGEVVVSVRRLPGSGMVELAVKDRGPGIPDDVLARIFDPFFSTKSPACSCGLGLGVVQRIARAHRARVCVDSVPGQGTTFAVLFPEAPLDE